MAGGKGKRGGSKGQASRKARVKLSPETAAKFREAGYEVENGAVSFEARDDETASVRDDLPRFRRNVGGGINFERTPLPYSARNIDAFRRDVERNPERFAAMKDEGQYFAFKLFGKNSRSIFEDIELLLEYLEHYSAFDDDPDEAWEAFELFRTDDTWRGSPRETRKQAPRPRNRDRKPKWQTREDYLADRAEAARAYRARIRDQQAARYQDLKERDRQRKRAEYHSDPNTRLKEKLRKRAYRRQLKHDERNGY